MLNIHNPYHEVTFFNLNQINTQADPNPKDCNLLLSRVWEQNQLAFCFANPASDSHILLYQPIKNGVTNPKFTERLQNGYRTLNHL